MATKVLIKKEPARDADDDFFSWFSTKSTNASPVSAPILDKDDEFLLNFPVKIKKEPLVIDPDDAFINGLFSYEPMVPPPPLPAKPEKKPEPKIPVKREPKEKKPRKKAIILDDLPLAAQSSPAVVVTVNELPAPLSSLSLPSPSVISEKLPSIPPPQTPVKEVIRPVLPLETPTTPTPIKPTKPSPVTPVASATATTKKTIQPLSPDTYGIYLLTTDMATFEAGEAEEQRNWDKMHADCLKIQANLAVIQRLKEQLMVAGGQNLVLIPPLNKLEELSLSVQSTAASIREKNLKRTQNTQRLVNRATAISMGAVPAMDAAHTSPLDDRTYLLNFDNGSLQPYTRAEEVCLSEFDLIRGGSSSDAGKQ